MLPIQITVRSIEDSLSIEYHVYKYYRKMHMAHPRINRCRVVVDVVQKHRHKGKIFSVSVDTTIAGRQVVCNKHNQNLFSAIHETFDAMDRMLERYSKKKSPRFSKYDFYYRNNFSGTGTSMLEAC